MVHGRVWEEAWDGRRRKSWQELVEGQEVLCIGCLERRLGRTLVASDFTDAPCNNPSEFPASERKRDRLTATVSRRLRGRPKGSKNKPKTTTDGRGDASPHRYLDEAPPM
jgi:hypothetical protein